MSSTRLSKNYPLSCNNNYHLAPPKLWYFDISSRESCRRPLSLDTKFEAHRLVHPPLRRAMAFPRYASNVTLGVGKWDLTRRSRIKSYYWIPAPFRYGIVEWWTWRWDTHNPLKNRIQFSSREMILLGAHSQGLRRHLEIFGWFMTDVGNRKPLW